MSTCPECGAEVTYAVHEARVLTGTCADCHRVTTLVEGTLPLGSSGSPSSPPTDSPAPPPAGGPECADCGGPLTVRALEDGTLEVACEECDTTTKFVPQEGARPPPPPVPERRWERGPRRPSASVDGAPRTRPCRQCGAPLSFTTSEDGTLVGECASCGNRFSLPPRRTGPPGPRGDYRGRYGDRGSSRFPKTDRRWPSRDARGGRRFGDRPDKFRPRGRPQDSGADSDDDVRRRRRPRRE